MAPDSASSSGLAAVAERDKGGQRSFAHRIGRNRVSVEITAPLFDARFNSAKEPFVRPLQIRLNTSRGSSRRIKASSKFKFEERKLHGSLALSPSKHLANVCARDFSRQIVARGVGGAGGERQTPTPTLELEAGEKCGVQTINMRFGVCLRNVRKPLNFLQANILHPRFCLWPRIPENRKAAVGSGAFQLGAAEGLCRVQYVA